MAAGVLTWRRDNFSGGVDDQCRYLLAKFRPQEVPWVPGGSGPSSSCPYSPKCVDVEFLELRLDGVLRSSLSLRFARFLDEAEPPSHVAGGGGLQQQGRAHRQRH